MLPFIFILSHNTCKIIVTRDSRERERERETRERERERVTKRVNERNRKR